MPLPAGALGLAALVGGSLLAGSLAAAVVRLPERLAAMLTAFGGGVLLAAVALELVPEADRRAGPELTAVGLLAGMAVYVAADAWLSRDAGRHEMRRSARAAAAGRRTPIDGREVGRGESIAFGLFVDGVPESMALGLTIAEGELGVALLAGIVAGNLVEAYGAARPIIAGGRSPRFAVALLGAIGAALAAATIVGATVLADVGPAAVGAAQAVAGGAVLAVVSIAVIPHAFDEVSRAVASATVLGFIAGHLLS